MDTFSSDSRRYQPARFMAEIVLIVGSILLAFAIQAWWEDAQTRREERSFLAGLEADFNDHRIALVSLGSSHDKLVEATDNLLRLSAGKEWTVMEADTLLLTLTYVPSYEAGDGTLAAILGAGKLDVLRDERLRELLAAWRREIEELRDMDVTMRNYVFNSLLPLLDSHGVPVSRAVSTRHPSWPTSLMEPSESIRSYQSLLSDVRFSNFVTVRRDWAMVQAWNAGHLVNYVDSVLLHVSRKAN